MKNFEEHFDGKSWDSSLTAIKQKGEADLIAGKIVSAKVIYMFALRLAEIFEQQKGFRAPHDLKKLKDISTHPQFTEAMRTMWFLMQNGKGLSDAFSYRPAVFFPKFIEAIKAGEKDPANFAAHILNFIKYRELLGALHKKFDNQDYSGLREEFTNR